jgi:Ser/Thr protein kinase RdoA (MazF antagonist)
VLDAVEAALGGGARATGRSQALNSMENRVYDLELEGDDDEPRHVVAKFYRPGRWSREAILDEHRFLGELVEAEVPAVAPLPLVGGSTVACTASGIWFALFAKVRGRSLPELADDQLAQFGRFIARIHSVGASAPAPHRPQLSADSYGRQSLALLLSRGLIDIQLQSRYQRVVDSIVAIVEPLLAPLPSHRLHGDCHLGNLLWQGSSPIFLDFDDLLSGPAVQDIWMATPGRDDETQRQREILLRGYEQLRHFDRATLRLIEPLRALRMIHFSAWIGRRWGDPTFARMFPDFTSYRYWSEETSALEDQLRHVIAATAGTG